MLFFKKEHESYSVYVHMSHHTCPSIRFHPNLIVSTYCFHIKDKSTSLLILILEVQFLIELPLVGSAIANLYFVQRS